MRTNPDYKRIAKEYGLKEQQVNDIYLSVFKFIKGKINSFPDFKTVPIEEFDKLKTNFHIPALGKLGITRDRILYLNNKIYGKDFKGKEVETDVHSIDHNNE